MKGIAEHIYRERVLASRREFLFPLASRREFVLPISPEDCLLFTVRCQQAAAISLISSMEAWRWHTR
jgi:hypothetical protein